MNKLCLLLLFCIILFKSNGQPGSLDRTFGNNGIQTTSFFNNLNSLGEEGKVVLTSANGGFFVVVSTNDITRIVKYLPDGRPDSSYGNAGYSNAAYLNAASAVMQGNKIVVAGYTLHGYVNSHFALARYTVDGTLDSSFGVNGIVITAVGDISADYAYSITLQGDKLLVAGSTDNFGEGYYGFALTRYTADGTLDATFGKDGKITTVFGSSYAGANAIVLQGSKIILAGYTRGFFSEYADFALARYTADGGLDSTFGENGKVTTDFNNLDDYARSIALQGNKIVVAGYTGSYINDDFTSDFALARYTADGALDSTFGVNGLLTTDFNNYDQATSIVLQEEKIVACGYTGDYSTDNRDFALARYTKDGVLDASFGNNGKVITDFNNSQDAAYSIALQEDGIIVAGSTYNVIINNEDFALARYTADGDLDPFFGKSGLLTGHFPVSQTYFTSVAMQENKIVAAGYTTNDNYNTDFAIARYTTAGILDTTFGKNGKVTTDFDGYNDKANSMMLQGDKILMGGSTYNIITNNDDFALARYTKNGDLDSSFGVNGIVRTDFNNSSDYANAIVLQGDKIIAVGYSSGTFGFDFALARYTANGKLDSSFGVNGKVTTDFKLINEIDNSDDYARSIALQGDRIIVSGIKHVDANGTDFALARYTKDGVLDASFGNNGKVITDFVDFSDDYANSIALQEDKIIVAGNVEYNSTASDFILARYTTDGKLDSAFGKNGKVLTSFTDFDNDYNAISSIALQGDKLIAAGYSGYYNEDDNRDFALARYMADGTLDSSFGKNGKVTTDLEFRDFLQASIVHQNKLYAVGGVGSLNIIGGNFRFGQGDTYGAVAAYQLEASGPTISIADVTVSESKRFAIVTVRLSAPVKKLVRVHYATRNKTAVSNGDYLSISGPLFFIPGVNNTAKIIIPIIDDNKNEGDEQFDIVLSNAHNAIIQDSIGVVTILDNDNAPIAKQSTSLHIITSPNPSKDVFTIQLQGSNLKQQVNVRVYDVSGRLLEQRNNIFIGQSLRLGDQYKTGTYIIEAVQGSQSVQTKVIKAGK